ncbi:hypothetical protein P7K49_021904 [Saguinus oedipus]|uniref:Uncharacterized protein n=1 Tax=Saguinus oedipus TaxID=9490 RepID=A0ABQ9UU17_SAGOE|nr:hypothetical protein P7K49_021904 [Saguinus oedipus]
MQEKANFTIMGMFITAATAHTPNQTDNSQDTAVHLTKFQLLLKSHQTQEKEPSLTPNKAMGTNCHTDRIKRSKNSGECKPQTTTQKSHPHMPRRQPHRYFKGRMPDDQGPAGWDPPHRPFSRYRPLDHCKDGRSQC